VIVAGDACVVQTEILNGGFSRTRINNIYVTAILLRLNVVFICLNKLGEHRAPAHSPISGVVIAYPWSNSSLDALIRSMYIVGVPYKSVHLFTQLINCVYSFEIPVETIYTTTAARGCSFFNHVNTTIIIFYCWRLTHRPIELSRKRQINQIATTVFNSEGKRNHIWLGLIRTSIAKTDHVKCIWFKWIFIVVV